MTWAHANQELGPGLFTEVLIPIEPRALTFRTAVLRMEKTKVGCSVFTCALCVLFLLISIYSAISMRPRRCHSCQGGTVIASSSFGKQSV